MKLIHPFIILLVLLVSSSYGEMYKWVDDKGTVHFTDDISNIPEKYRQGIETRKPPQETSAPQPKERSVLPTTPETSEAEGFEVKLFLDRLKESKMKYEKQGFRVELNQVNNAIRYFKIQLDELERKASFAGVPRN